MATVKFGPGTLTYTLTGGSGTAQEFAQEVKSGGINHGYEEVGEATTYLSGTTVPAGEIRADSLTYEADFDLSGAGLYQFLMTNDLSDATVEFTPNTTAGASWTGLVRLKLPESATAESFGALISGSVEHAFVGPVTFTPAGATP